MPATTNQDFDGSLQCMEVWGGSCNSEDALHRPGLDIWVYSRSTTDTTEAGGGDVHLISSCASGRITRLLLADICGIGTMFDQVAGDLRQLMKRNVNTIRQDRIVRSVSRRLDESAQQGGFASILLGTYFSPTRSLSVCNAGHTPPFLYRASEASWSVLQPAVQHTTTTPSAEGTLALSEYQQCKTKLEVDDRVLFYGSQLAECKSGDGTYHGIAGLLDRVRELSTESPESLIPTLLERLATEHEENASVTDTTALLLQANESKVPLRDNVLAPFRLLGNVSDSTRFE